MANTTDALLQGQIEALLPQLQAAKVAADAAKAAEQALRDQIRSLLGDQPQTVKTTWGTVTLCKGSKRQTIVCPALKAEIAFLQAQGLKDGRTVEKIGEPTLKVTFS